VVVEAVRGRVATAVAVAVLVVLEQRQDFL
jgi:hypothetical protein